MKRWVTRTYKIKWIKTRTKICKLKNYRNGMLIFIFSAHLTWMTANALKSYMENNEDFIFSKKKGNRKLKSTSETKFSKDGIVYYSSSLRAECFS